MRDTHFLGNCHTAVRTQLRRYRMIIDASGSLHFVAAHHLVRAPPPSTSCYELCRQAKCDGGCPCAHIDSTSSLHLAAAAKSADRRRIVVCGAAGKGLAEVDTSTVEQTAGYVLYEELTARGFSALHPRLCPDAPDCPRGVRCLYLHAGREAAAVAPPPSPEGGLSLSQCFSGISRSSLTAFLQHISERYHLKTVGDLQSLSPATFDALVSKASNADDLDHWLLLAGLRRFEPQHPLAHALGTFNGVATRAVDNLPRTMQTVEQLWSMPRGAFYSLVGVVPLEVFEACEKLRQRNDDVTYHSCLIAQMPQEYFMTRMVHTVLGARERFHCSWRKHDPNRPIIISLITYVDAEGCHCRRGEPKARMALSQSIKSASTRLTDSMRSPPLSPRSAAISAAAMDETIWCTCERRYEMACNYELSTPSGSRCCEQNCMGKIASTGAPTDSLREVLVWGMPSSRGDPNPLFPCGVCENMLRRIAKDVSSTHGGDLTLVMFERGTDPTKLIMVPMSDVSLKDSGAFRAFVQDVTAREDALDRSAEEEP